MGNEKKDIPAAKKNPEFINLISSVNYPNTIKLKDSQSVIVPPYGKATIDSKNIDVTKLPAGIYSVGE